MNRKYISGLLAGLLTFSTVMPVSAADTVSAADAVHRAKALTPAAAMTDTDDYNVDGAVNAIDLTLMKRDLLAAEDSGELTA